MIGTIISNRVIGDQIYELKIRCSILFEKEVLPGQFLHIQIPDAGDTILRRPVSINSYDRNAKEFTLVYQLKGKGTKRLSQLNAGTQLDFTGPLGNGFSIPKDAKSIFLVGGGVGVAPLRYLAEAYPDRVFTAFLGFRTERTSYQTEIFRKHSQILFVATEDGSMGRKGFITEQVKQVMELGKKPDLICACGPTPMLRSLQKIVHDIPCLISLEERMGCGVGACRACVCKVKQWGEETYKRVCCDGPVFDMKEVIL